MWLHWSLWMTMGMSSQFDYPLYNYSKVVVAVPRGKHSVYLVLGKG